jgi:hypothetical protein
MKKILKSENSHKYSNTVSVTNFKHLILFRKISVYSDTCTQTIHLFYRRNKNLWYESIRYRFKLQSHIFRSGKMLKCTEEVQNIYRVTTQTVSTTWSRRVSRCIAYVLSHCSEFSSYIVYKNSAFGITYVNFTWYCNSPELYASKACQRKEEIKKPADLRNKTIQNGTNLVDILMLYLHN